MDGLKRPFIGRNTSQMCCFGSGEAGLKTSCLFSRGAEGVPEVQQLPAFTHHRVPGRRGGRPAAERGHLRGGSDPGVHQVSGGGLHVSAAAGSGL